MEDECIIHTVNITCAVVDNCLDNLLSLGGIVEIETDSDLEFQGIGEFGPLGEVAVKDEVLLADDYLGVILKGSDIAVKFADESIVKLLYGIILGNKCTAIAISAGFSVLDVTVDIGGINGSISSQDAYHGSVCL